MHNQIKEHPIRPKALGEITFLIVLTAVFAIAFPPSLVTFVFLSPLVAKLASCATFPYCPDLAWIYFILFLAFLFVFLPIIFGIFLLKVAVDFYAMKAWTWPWAMWVVSNRLARITGHEKLYQEDLRQAFGQPITDRNKDNG